MPQRVEVGVMRFAKGRLERVWGETDFSRLDPGCPTAPKVLLENI